ncbi:cell wall assembly protein [Streptomyces sp. CB01201]|uniref:SMI1/KNR4 family protein n=1 Tax=Streptomyces sp. CB01201 TaxID=2020324 RepID=UPI000C27032F|nr:SMI1/KNR4 family protein [Streptomyces sp. CB01201]PJM98500.1 cell wall assembly protein [Streptomyces sp. CB01201]
MEIKHVDWLNFLARWSEEWADAHGHVDELSPEDAAARRGRWLGADPATEADIAAMEDRLGRAMPPSYREFLRVSDGWRHAGGFVWKLAGTREARWHNDEMGLGEDFDEFWGEEDNPEEVRAQVGLWSRALQLDVESDITFVLLDPEDVGPDGEWAVRVWASWRAEDPERYPSFAAFMIAMHQEWHTLAPDRSSREGGPTFVNGTTRTQDAAVARARTAALSGRHEEAAALLEEAGKYGRPYAHELLDQIAQLGGTRGRGVQMPHPDNPRFLSEQLPLKAADLLNSGRPPEDWHYSDPAVFPDTAQTAADIQRAVREGTYRYRPGGAFGEAVHEAREQARWGDTDAAWQVLRAVIPLWEPLGPGHIAPVGLLADPLLAPVLTAERRLELLRTPRGGESGPAPAPAGDRNPDGLSWLVRPGALRPWQTSTSDYRMILVEGIAPDELPALLGSSPGTPLSPPLRQWDVTRHHRSGQRIFSSYDDKALLSVGRAGPDWSFAFEQDPSAGFDTPRFVSPAPAASAPGGRAIVIWHERRRGTPVFHVSAGEGGTPRYAFTVRGGTLETSAGAVPVELAPPALGFDAPDADGQASAAAQALDAIARIHAVTVPRLALTEGRLHTFESLSWSRPPGPGETYTTISIG